MMIKKISSNNKGAAAVEFAMIAPVFIAMIFGIIVICLVFWRQNILEEVASESARCLAVGGEACTVLDTNCATNQPECYIIETAQLRGLAGLTSSEISINSAKTIEQTTFTSVSITYPFKLLGYEYTLSANADFPNS